jgi:UDP-N-acetylglucosamine 2-epimerase (non-hydrolysing)
MAEPGGASAVWLIVGTRPEAVKMAPVAHALRSRGARALVVTTGQHADLAPAALAEAGLAADIALAAGAAGRDPAEMVGALVPALAARMRVARPAMVLVQGDTVSALAGAMAAAYARVPVAHVEAGLRSDDRGAPWPEELHRRMIAPLADLHFAPTAGAAAALRAEGIVEGVHVTGNTGIDALFAAVARGGGLPELPQGDGPLLLVTVHRRENLGAPLAGVCAAVRTLAAGGARIAWPVHPSPAVGKVVREALGDVPGVALLEPLGHGAAASLMAAADLVLTDSGGVQEEAPALGRRVLRRRAGGRAHRRYRAGTAGRRGYARAPSRRMRGTKSGKLVAMGAASSTVTGARAARPRTAKLMAMR